MFKPSNPPPFCPPMSVGGYYDETGKWIRNKFCFVSCHERCTCMPPNGIWELPKVSIESRSEADLELARRVISNRRTTPMTPEEINEWASKLAADTAGAND